MSQIPCTFFFFCYLGHPPFCPRNVGVHLGLTASIHRSRHRDECPFRVAHWYTHIMDAVCSICQLPLCDTAIPHHPHSLVRKTRRREKLCLPMFRPGLAELHKPLTSRRFVARMCESKVLAKFFQPFILAHRRQVKFLSFKITVLVKPIFIILKARKDI